MDSEGELDLFEPSESPQQNLAVEQQPSRDQPELRRSPRKGRTGLVARHKDRRGASDQTGVGSSSSFSISPLKLAPAKREGNSDADDEALGDVGEEIDGDEDQQNSLSRNKRSKPGLWSAFFYFLLAVCRRVFDCLLGIRPDKVFFFFL